MENNIYEQKSVFKLIMIFGIPSILSLIIEILTGVVDTAFAGNLAIIGSDALSSMALLTPILGIFTALQTLFAMSTGILMAKFMNNKNQRNSYFKTGVIMTLIISLITSLLCFIFMPSILNLIGAKGVVFQLAQQYLKIQLLSNIFSSLGYTLTSIIRALGYPRKEFIIITCAVFINIIFNYLFAFRLNMGMSGLAWGTFVSEFTCFVFSYLFLKRKNLWIYKEKTSIIEFFDNAWTLFKIGISQTFIQILAGLTGFIINYKLLLLGSSNYIASWSIVGKIYTFLLMPIVGITQGVETIISYFKGNNQENKINKISFYTILISLFYGIVAFIFVVLFKSVLINVFTNNSIILNDAKNILLIVFIGLPFIGILYTIMTLLQVTSHEFISVLLILSRQVFFLIPLLFIIPLIVNYFNLNILPIYTIFICIPIADLLAVILAIILKRKVQ